MTALPIVWLAGAPGLAHGFVGRAPGLHERIAATTRPPASRGALCGAWLRGAELRTEGGSRRRCKSCQRAERTGTPTKWMVDALTAEGERPWLAPSAALPHTTDRERLVRAVERDRSATMKLAARIARNVAREHLDHVAGADYLRRAVEEAAIATALAIAARLEREAASTAENHETKSNAA